MNFEIATPQTNAHGERHVSPFMGYIDLPPMSSASLQGQDTSPSRILASYQALRPPSPSSMTDSEPTMNMDSRSRFHPSRPPHPTSQDSAQMWPRSSRADLLKDVPLSHIPIGPATVTEVPQENNAAELRQVTEDVVQNSSSPHRSQSALGASTPSPRVSSNPSPASYTRRSTVPSLFYGFPSPPTESSAQMTSEVDMPVLEEKHESAFGQIVTGPPGAGKSTYSHGMHQVSLANAFGRRR